MIDWPVFKSGGAISASQMNKFVRGCKQLEKMIRANRLNPGVGYMLNQGPGGVSVSIRKSKSGKGGASVGMPFAVSVREEDVNGKKTYFAVVSKNGGVFSDIMGKPYVIPWVDGKVEFSIGGVGFFAVTLDWTYKQTYSSEEARPVQMDVVRINLVENEPKALKLVITPITGTDLEASMGNSRVVLAVVEGKMVGETLVFTVEQLVFSSLRAYWLPGYVDDVPGAIGQYADVSVGYFSKE